MLVNEVPVVTWITLNTPDILWPNIDIMGLLSDTGWASSPPPTSKETADGDFTKYGQPVPRHDPTWGVGIAHFDKYFVQSHIKKFLVTRQSFYSILYRMM